MFLILSTDIQGILELMIIIRIDFLIKIKIKIYVTFT